MRPNRRNNWAVVRQSAKFRKERRYHTEVKDQVVESIRDLDDEELKIAIQLQQQMKIQKKQTEGERVQTQPNLIMEIGHNQECFCDDCDCGRHLCKITDVIPRPQIQMRTVYQISFGTSQLQSKTTKIDNKLTCNSIPIPSSITSKSIYETSFKPQETDQLYNIFEQKKSTGPQDEIIDQSEAPTQKATTYTSTFIGHRGMNQYVKSTQCYINRALAFKGISSYQRDFIPKSGASSICSFYRAESQKQRNLRKMIHRSTCVSSYQKSYGNFLDEQNQQEDNEKDKDKYKEENKSKQLGKTLNRFNFKQSFLKSQPFPARNDDFTFVSSAKVSISNQKPTKSTYNRQFQIRNGNVYCPARLKIKHSKNGELFSIKRKLKDNSNFKQFLIDVTN